MQISKIDLFIVFLFIIILINLLFGLEYIWGMWRYECNM